MSSPPFNSNSTSRPVGKTEHSWCKAVPTGTGITILALLFSTPINLPHLQTCIQTLQLSHPILLSKLHFTPSTNTFSISTPSTPTPVHLHPPTPLPLSFQLTIEHEMNTTSTWQQHHAHAHATTQDHDVINKDDDVINKDDDVINKDDVVINKDDDVINKDGDVINKDDDVINKDDDVINKDDAVINKDDDVINKDDDVINKDDDVIYKDDDVIYKDGDVMVVSLYELKDGETAVVVRLHTAVCDRAAGAFVLRELVGMYCGGGGESVKEEGVGLAVEECVAVGKMRKPFWARGVDMIGYSVNSFRFSNLEFKEVGVPDSTRFVRLRIGVEGTDRILSGCKSKGIKLFGLLAAAGLIAAHASKNYPDEKWEKYSLATLIDCRSQLDPVLSDHHIGFYHSVIINSHDVNGGEDLWDLAQRIYTSLTNAKNNNKHFTDMADLNFLMCKAIENPSLTPSSSLRTSIISVFEDPLIENSNQFHKEVGLLDCTGCSSVHGVGPSLAIFDTIRDGELDCACVYPSPTHSREQMQDFVDHMKRILIDGSSVPQ